MKVLFINSSGENKTYRVPIIPRSGDKVFVFGFLQSVSSILLLPDLKPEFYAMGLDAVVTVE